VKSKKRTVNNKEPIIHLSLLVFHLLPPIWYTPKGKNTNIEIRSTKRLKNIEVRNSKYETNSNDKNPNFQNHRIE